MSATYFQDIVDTLKHIDVSKRNNLHYVPRNVWFYSWLLQKQRGSVERAQLYKLIGEEFRDRIDTTVDEAPEDCVERKLNDEEDGNGFLILKKPLLDAVEDYFMREYSINDTIPNFGRMNGKRFIRRLNNLTSQPSGGLIVSVSSFLNDALEARFSPVENYVTDIRLTKEDRDIIDTLRVVSSPRRIKDISWKFLLCVFPHNGALTQEVIDHMSGVLRWFSQQLDDCPVLFLSSSVNGTTTTDMLGHDRHIHFMWAFSSIRLLQGVVPTVEKYGDAAIRTFPAIFKMQNQQTLSAKQALQNWEDSASAHLGIDTSYQPEKKK